MRVVTYQWWIIKLIGSNSSQPAIKQGTSQLAFKNSKLSSWCQSQMGSKTTFCLSNSVHSWLRTSILLFKTLATNVDICIKFSFLISDDYYYLNGSIYFGLIASGKIANYFFKIVLMLEEVIRQEFQNIYIKSLSLRLKLI